MNQLFWNTTRAAGLVAWFLLAAATVWGLVLSQRWRGLAPRPAWTLDLHRFLGGLAVVFTGVHVAAILADSYTHFGLTDVLVPFASSWHPGAVAWGIVALYLLLAVEVTSLARKHLKSRTWRRFHVLSLPLFPIATMHLLRAGTDARNGVVRLVVVVVGVVIGGLVAWRIGAVVASRRADGRLDRVAAAR